jgi:hypothetical protein
MNQLNNMYKEVKILNLVIIILSAGMAFYEVIFLYLGFVAIIMIDLALIYLSRNLINKLFDKDEFMQGLLEKYLKLTLIFLPITELLDYQALYNLNQIFIALIYAMVLGYSFLFKSVFKYAIAVIGTCGLIVLLFAGLNLAESAILILLIHSLYLKHMKKEGALIKNIWIFIIIIMPFMIMFDTVVVTLIIFLIMELLKISDKEGLKYVYLAYVAALIFYDESFVILIISQGIILTSLFYKKSIIKKIIRGYNVWF